MLVAGLALLGVTLYFGFLTGTAALAPNDRTVIDAWWRSASAPR